MFVGCVFSEYASSSRLESHPAALPISKKAIFKTASERGFIRILSEREIDGGLEKGGVNTPGFALRGSPGRFTYTGQWQPNERYEVFVSENLRDWTELGGDH